MDGYLFDSHTHLDMKPLADNPAAIIARAKKAGLSGMVSIGIDPESCRENIELAHKFEMVYAAAGIHPHKAEEATDGALLSVERMASDDVVVAIGETGLDYYRNYADREAQKDAFRKQISLAKKLGKPLIVHDREAHRDVLKIIDEEGVPGAGGIFHCFSGTVSFARECIERGFMISIPGVVTYKNARPLVTVVKDISADHLLIETDAPFLTPAPHRGKPNEPALIIHTAEKIARIKGLSLQDVGRITGNNALRVFGIKKSFEYEISYRIRNSIYLNITNRCTNSCIFCSKRKDFFVKGHFLKLSEEPSIQEIVESVPDPSIYEEVVFCGFGEPTLRLQDMLQAAVQIRNRGARKIRLNTDGLANLVHGRDVIPDLAGVIDSMSVSMNAPDRATYHSLCPNPYGESSFDRIVEFIAKAGKSPIEVTATVVAIPGLDTEKCRVLAEEKLGVAFRIREYNEVG